MGSTYMFHILSFILPVLLNIYIGKRIGLRVEKTLLLTCFTSVLGYAILILLPWLESGQVGALNMVKIFVFTAPLYYLASHIFKVNFRTICDIHCVYPVFLFSISHLPCIVDDCCNGFDYVEGTQMYALANALSGTNRLPLELIECISAFITTVVLLGIGHKKRFELNGRLHFVMIITYGVQRFFWEILRNNDKIVVFGKMPDAISGDFGLSIHNFYCIAMILVGIIFLVGFHIADQKNALKN